MDDIAQEGQHTLSRQKNTTVLKNMPQLKFLCMRSCITQL